MTAYLLKPETVAAIKALILLDWASRAKDVTDHVELPDQAIETFLNAEANKTLNDVSETFKRGVLCLAPMRGWTQFNGVTSPYRHRPTAPGRS